MASSSRPFLEQILARGEKSKAESPAGAIAPLYFTLDNEADRKAFYIKILDAKKNLVIRDNGINVNDPHELSGAFTSFKSWNRFDLAALLSAFLTQHHKPIPPNAMSPPATQEEGILRLGERGKVDWMLATFLAKCPPLPGIGTGSLVPHRGSVIAFLNGDVGHTFTGLVKLWLPSEDPRLVRPKIFLVAIGPSISNKGDAYPVRPPAAGPIRLFKNTGVTPIIHQQTGSGAASHTQVADIIKQKPKHQDFNQLDGCYVGFTIIKGSAGQGIGNRYGFTSASSNSKSFFPMGATASTGCTTEDWGKVIKAACDQLLALDGDAADRAVVLTDQKIPWQAIKEKYWPCRMPVIKTTEVLQKPSADDDDWK